MTRAASPLRRMRAVIRNLTEGDEPLCDLLRKNGLRVRIEGDATLIEPFDMDKPVQITPNTKGKALGQIIEGLANGERHDG